MSPLGEIKHLNKVDKTSFIHFHSIGYVIYLFERTHLNYQGYQIYVLSDYIDRSKQEIEG